MTTFRNSVALMSCSIVTAACCGQDRHVTNEVGLRSGERPIALIRPQTRDTATEHYWLARGSQFVLWSEVAGDSIRVNGHELDTVLVVPVTPLWPKVLVIALNDKAEGMYTVQWSSGPKVQIEVDSGSPTIYTLVLDQNSQVVIETNELTGLRE